MVGRNFRFGVPYQNQSGVNNMRKWNLAITYVPKIAGVVSGEVSQTIRNGLKYKEGDVISFHGWEGRPYRSKWSFRTPYMPIIHVCDVRMCGDGVEFIKEGDVEIGVMVPWNNLDELAKRDGISPPTGCALKSVLGMDMNNGDIMDAQIIRWDSGVKLDV